MRPIAAWWPPQEKNGSQMSSSQMPHFSLKSLKGWPPSTKCRRESILGQLKCEEVNCKKSIPKVRRSQLQEVNSREAIVKWTQLLVHTPAYGGWSILLSTKIKNSYQIGGQFNSSEERKKISKSKSGKHSEKTINKKLFGAPYRKHIKPLAPLLQLQNLWILFVPAFTNSDKKQISSSTFIFQNSN